MANLEQLESFESEIENKESNVEEANQKLEQAEQRLNRLQEAINALSGDSTIRDSLANNIVEALQEKDEAQQASISDITGGMKIPGLM